MAWAPAGRDLTGPGPAVTDLATVADRGIILVSAYLLASWPGPRQPGPQVMRSTLDGQKQNLAILVEPYHRGRLFAFVVPPNIRLGILGICLVLLAVALVRALLARRGFWSIASDGLLFIGVAYVAVPLWNRFIVHPLVRKGPRKDRIGFLAFFELFSLLTASWIMLARAIWGALPSN